MPRAKQDKNPPSNHARRDADKPKQRESRRANRHAVDSTDFSSLDPQQLLSAIVAITRAGCAVQLGLTKDGGAMAFRFVGDGDEPYTEYLRPSEDAELYLQGVCEDFTNRD